MNKDSVFEVIKQALRFFWRNKDDFLRLGLIPTIITFLIAIPLGDIVARLVQAEDAERVQILLGNRMQLMGYSLLYLLAVGFFSTNWLQFLAFGPTASGFFGTHIKRAHLRFCMALFLAVIFLSTIANLLAISLAQILPIAVIFILSIGLGLFFLLRLTPFFIGLAIERHMKMSEAWRLSRPLVLPLFSALFLLQLLLFAIEQGLMVAMGLTGLVRAAPYATYFLVSFVEMARFAISFTLIFSYYRRMAELRLVA